MRLTSALTMGAAFTAATIFFASHAQAADYPNRPITLIVGTVGGTTEPVVRLVEQKINDRHPIKFLYEAKPGASGTVAGDYVARAKPDGYTLLLPTGAVPVWPAVYKNLPFDLIKDFDPVAIFGKAQLVLVATKAFPADNLVDLVKAAKASPGKYAYGSVGIGSINQIVAEELKIKTAIDLLHVPYTGSGDVVRGMLTGDLPLAVLPPTAVLQQIGAGALKPIAVLSPVRSPALPNVPIALDSIPGLGGHEFWIGLLAPAGTPKDIVALLHDYIDEAMQDPSVVTAITNIGFQPVRESVDQFRARLRTDVDDFRAIAKAANISLD